MGVPVKFSDGYWISRPGYRVEHPRHIAEIAVTASTLRAYAPVRPVQARGAELDTPEITVTIDPVTDGIIRVRLERHRGYPQPAPELQLNLPAEPYGSAHAEGLEGWVTAGELQAHIHGDSDFGIDFAFAGKPLTGTMSVGTSTVSTVDPTRPIYDASPDRYMVEQLKLAVGETVYGLGERFGPVVKNGQSVDLWNADGGTATEQAYKNVPFYLTSAGYGVFVNHPGRVSYEVGSEVNSRVQFSAAGDLLEYFLIAGPTPADVLRRYTELTGRAPQVPAWSYGLWLSTSFTTDYSESTVMSFVERMEELEIPVSVLHFDCYWMRPSHWCDFQWDPAFFPDPEGMLSRLHDHGLKVCVWINPYIAGRSALFEEAREKGYLARRADGGVRQWDHWQAGLAWVDFTNPAATAWWKDKLRVLLRQGVDSFKTDFGERVPLDIAWHDNSDPERMHNYYTELYNRAAYEVIAEERGVEEAIVFARSATAGGQKYPVHWGGDSEPTFVSMAETLRGGLSLGLSGFGYWSHDMGGFEGTPDPAVFTRWFPFGMLSSHSRLHGSRSYRVPWNYGDEAVVAARRFTRLKNRLMPYIATHAQDVTSAGLPLLRHMLLEFPADLGSRHVDTQYMFGPDLLVAPVFTHSGEVDVYLPSGGWTSILDGAHHASPGWHREEHATDSLPLLVRDGTILPVSLDASRPDHNWQDGLALYCVRPQPGERDVPVVGPDGTRHVFSVAVSDRELTITAPAAFTNWHLVVVDPQVPLYESEATSIAPELTAGRVFSPLPGERVLRVSLQS